MNKETSPETDVDFVVFPRDHEWRDDKIALGPYQNRAAIIEKFGNKLLPWSVHGINGDYIGEKEKGVPDGWGIWRTNEFFDVYFGHWKRGVFDGFGCLWILGGEHLSIFLWGGPEIRVPHGGGCYKGELKAGLPNGYGEFDFHGGRYVSAAEHLLNESYHFDYKGDFVNGKRHGNGTAIYRSKGFYIGEWKDGSRHGYGCFYSHPIEPSEILPETKRAFPHDPRLWSTPYGDVRPDSSFYRGQWVDNIARGEGESYSDGQTQIGKIEGMPMGSHGSIMFFLHEGLTFVESDESPKGYQLKAAVIPGKPPYDYLYPPGIWFDSDNVACYNRSKDELEDLEPQKALMSRPGLYHDQKTDKTAKGWSIWKTRGWGVLLDEIERHRKNAYHHPEGERIPPRELKKIDPQNIIGKWTRKIEEDLQSRLALQAVDDDPAKEEFYAAAMEELEKGNMDKGLWARLLVVNDGDEKKTRIAYLKERAERLNNLKDT